MKKERELKFDNRDKVFIPTQTTQYLCKDIEKKILRRKNLSLADMGCGNGIIGISLFKKINNIKNLHFSDISKEAILACQKNLKINKIKDAIFLISFFLSKPSALIKKGFIFETSSNFIPLWSVAKYKLLFTFLKRL